MDKIFALRLSDKGLKLRSSEGVYEAGFGNDEEKDLSTGESRKLICLGEIIRLDKR